MDDRPRGRKDDRGRRPDEPRSARADNRGGERRSAERAAEPEPRDEPRPSSDDLDVEQTTEPQIAWGSEDDSPPPAIQLGADLPTEPPPDDDDPLTHPLLSGPSAQLGDDIASVVGVRVVPGGRVQWCDAGEADYGVGERVVVSIDTGRGQRLGWVAVPPARRAVQNRGMGRVIRRANEHDLRGEREGDADRARALRQAKDIAAALRLPVKVFRVEGGRGRWNVYYTSDERLDLRDFIRDVSAATSSRIELRQLGVRDEAKAVGGIGSCGLTLCCTTWLPDFVPVSIKMAKDQGLVLSPTKVSGQCGRLKCCLVYEQAGYAELRKGLPKLGKRVISPRGEGRIVEVDVLRQRVRVSYGPGETEVLAAADVRPMFPSGSPPPGGRPQGPGPRVPDDGHDADDDEEAHAEEAHPEPPPADAQDDAALPDDDADALTRDIPDDDVPPSDGDPSS